MKKKLIVSLFYCFIVTEKKSNLTMATESDSVQQCNNSKSPRGFTLIELLIVMAVMVSVLAIVVGITSSTLRGSNKTSTINNVRENGNYAISQMSRVIKYAKSFDGVSEDGDPPWECQPMPPPPLPTPTPIPYKFLKVTSFDGQQTVFSCDSATIYSNGDPLIDTDSVELDPWSCIFTCRQDRITDSPTVSINFTLISKTTSLLVEQKASIPFAVSIKTRN